MWRRLSAILTDVLVGLLLAGVVVAGCVSGFGLAGAGPVLGLGLVIVACTVCAGQAIRRRIPPARG
jgi:hypothetical protein